MFCLLNVLGIFILYLNAATWKSEDSSTQWSLIHLHQRAKHDIEF